MQVSIFAFLWAFLSFISSSMANEAHLDLAQDTSKIIATGGSLPIGITYIDARDGQMLLDEKVLRAELTSSQPINERNCKDGKVEESKTDEKKPYRFDIELRAYSINGFNPFDGKSKTPYNEANFNAGVDSKVKSQMKGNDSAELQQLFDNLMKSGKFSDDQKNEVYDSMVMNLLANASESERKTILAQVGQELSFDRQMEFVAKLGGRMNERYDKARNKQSIAAAGTGVSCSEILANLNSSNEVGVCRDIVMCQAQILEQMGNKGNVYGVSFAVIGNYHVTLVAQDPKNPSRIHKINYDNRTVEDDKQGSAALAQSDSADVGLGYRLWNPKGEMVGEIPSQMGLILNEVTGGNNRSDFDPMTRTDYNIVQIGAGYEGFYGRVFASQLDNGDTVYGVAAQYAWGTPDNKKDKQGIVQQGHIGIAYAHRDLLRISGANGETREYDVNQAYLNLQQRVAYQIKPNEKLTITPYVDMRLQATVVEGSEKTADSKSKWTGDGSLAADIGVEAEWIIDPGRTHVGVQLYGQVTPGLNDLSALSSPSIVANHIVFGATVDHKVSSEVALNAYLLASFREYGNSGTAGVGLTHTGKSTTTRFNMGVVGPLGEGQAWMPGGNVPSIMFGVSQDIHVTDTTRIDWNVNYTQQLSDPYIFQVNSGLGVHF